MPTLYYTFGACTLAPHVALEWIGAHYRAVKVQCGFKELFAVNPAGTVPSLLEDDGWFLTHAVAILDWLASKLPEAGVSGGDGLRAKANAPFWPIFIPHRYTIDKCSAALQALVEAGQMLAAKQFESLNRHFDGRKCILDGGRSMIDAYAFPMIRWQKRFCREG